jgi:secreted trypsin-like serine protease
VQNNALPNNRIIGGNVASEGQFPYHAGVIVDGAQFCGATLISPEYLITAAHCIYRYKVED